MIPIRDNIPARSAPIVNYALIAACAVTFLHQLSLGSGVMELITVYGMIPARLTGRVTLVLASGETPAAWPSLFTSMFLHAGWIHLLGNMWFLYIFGDNVEDRLGHLKYLLFYLAAGLAASAVHVAFDPHSQVPVVGASGAIAAVMGAYMLLYPRAMIVTLVPVFFYPLFLLLPAVAFLAIWFVIQLLGGFSMGSATAHGVAWWAHVGGFVAGMVGVYTMGRAGWLRRPLATVVRSRATFRPYYYRYRRW